MDRFLNEIFTQASQIEVEFVSSVEFGGFDLAQVQATAMDTIGNPQLCLQLAIIGAMRGNDPRDSDTIQLANGQSLRRYLDERYRDGTFARQGERIGAKLTLARLSQAFAEPVIQALMRVHQRKPLRKRFPRNKLPPYLEFMGAGSLNMPREFRDEHRLFAQEFSEALAHVGGSFNETIYNAMESSATDPRTRLFSSITLEETKG